MVLACDRRGPVVRPAGRPCPARFVVPGFAYQRAAILVLLRDHDSSADEVARRLAALGFGRPVTVKVRYVLRVMEQEGLVRFSSAAGARTAAPRSVYVATDQGQDYLRRVTPILVGYRDALSTLVNRFQDGDGYRDARSNGRPAAPGEQETS